MPAVKQVVELDHEELVTLAQEKARAALEQGGGKVMGGSTVIFENEVKPNGDQTGKIKAIVSFVSNGRVRT
jgi:hypothetical protein